jgi:hypothetical protein
MLPQTDAARHTLARLITSFHILHRHNILNEAGTISIRNPSNPATFIINNRSAISISSPADLDEWYVDNGSLVQRAIGDLSIPPPRFQFRNLHPQLSLCQVSRRPKHCAFFRCRLHRLQPLRYQGQFISRSLQQSRLSRRIQPDL